MNNKRILKGLGGILSALFLVGTPAVAADEADILADVNGTKITQADLEEKLKTLPPQFQAQFQQNQALLLDELINQQLLFQEAEKQKLEDDEKVVNILKQLKKDLMVQRLVEKEVLEKVAVTDEDIQTAYESNKENFKSPDQIHAFHILVPDEKKAKEVKKRLKKGENFQELAKEVSVGPSGPRGGDLGMVQRGQLVPEFEEAAYKLEVGEISDIVKTQFGYHVITISEKNPARQLTLSEVSDNIKAQLQQSKQRELLQSYLKELKDKGTVKVY